MTVGFAPHETSRVLKGKKIRKDGENTVPATWPMVRGAAWRPTATFGQWGCEPWG